MWETDHSKKKNWFSLFNILTTTSQSILHWANFDSFHFQFGLKEEPMDTDFLRTLDRQILLGVFVAFVAASAGAAYYLSSSKKRRGLIPKFKTFQFIRLFGRLN